MDEYFDNLVRAIANNNQELLEIYIEYAAQRVHIDFVVKK